MSNLTLFFVIFGIITATADLMRLIIWLDTPRAERGAEPVTLYKVELTGSWRERDELALDQACERAA